jgi:uncharacterized protein YciI
MAEWIYFVRPPRDNFVATITEEEGAVMRDQHFPYLARLFRDGTLLLAGPTFGTGMNDGIAVIRAETEDEARAIMEADPAVTSGLMAGELRPMRVTFLAGRDS